MHYCIRGNFARRKDPPISPPTLIGEKFITLIFLSCVNDYIEDMATFTAFIHPNFLQHKGSWAW